MLKEPILLKEGCELEGLAKDAIRKLLTSIPGTQREIFKAPSRREWDFEVDLVAERGTQTLLCEVKGRAWPNEMHGVGHRFKRAIEQSSLTRCVPVFIAPYLSPQAIEACHELGMSWADLAGNCELKLEGAYIKILGIPSLYKKGRETASLYSPKSSSVVQVLLLAPQRRWTMAELARESGVSLGQVAAVKKLLDRNHWILSTRGGTTLSEPRKLLDDWVVHYKPRRAAIRLFTLDSPDKLENRIAATLSDYAFTEFSAAQQYAPYTRHQRIAFYVTKWDDGNSKRLELASGDGAANVTIYETGEPLSFVEVVNGRRCASPILTYLDLKLLAGRGQDSAERLLESVIEMRWK